jgi:hypothetical protein
MIKKIIGGLIGLGVFLILLGNFTTVSLAQTQEECDAYQVSTKNNGMFIENDFHGVEIIYDDITGRLTIDVDPAYTQYMIEEGKTSVEFIDTACDVSILAKNFIYYTTDETGIVYIIASDKKPVKIDFSLPPPFLDGTISFEKRSSR